MKKVYLYNILDPKINVILARRTHFQHWYYDKPSTRKNFLQVLIDILYSEYLAIYNNDIIDKESEYDDPDGLSLEELLLKYKDYNYVSINMFSNKKTLSKQIKKYETLLSIGINDVRNKAHENRIILPSPNDATAPIISYEHSRYKRYYVYYLIIFRNGFMILMV